KSDALASRRTGRILCPAAPICKTERADRRGSDGGRVDRSRAGLWYAPSIRARDARHLARSENRARATAHGGHQERGRSRPGRRLCLAGRAGGSVSLRDVGSLPGASARLSSLVLLGATRAKVPERSSARLFGADPQRAARSAGGLKGAGHRRAGSTCIMIVTALGRSSCKGRASRTWSATSPVRWKRWATVGA